jgi:hypothetical protein
VDVADYFRMNNFVPGSRFSPHSPTPKWGFSEHFPQVLRPSLTGTAIAPQANLTVK